MAVVIFWTIGFAHPEAIAETCGHYLFRNGHPVSISDRLADAGPDAGGGVSAKTGTRDPWQPEPCEGPGCRQHSIPLSAPPTVPLGTTASDLAALLPYLRQSDPLAAGSLLPESETGHFYQSEPVFRPPIFDVGLHH